MRITDNSIRQNFLSNYYTTKNDLSILQNQMATQKLINKPSDSPSEISPVMRLTEQFATSETYKKNIDNSFAQINSTIAALTNTQELGAKLRDDLALLKNSLIEPSTIVTSKQSIDFALKSIFDYANTKFDGRNLFGGNDHTNKPITFDTATNSYIISSSKIDGKQPVKIGSNLETDTSWNGAEVFASAINETGNFDVNAAIGTVINQKQEIFDADGNVYNFNVAYTKSSSNNYTMNYNVTDSTTGTPVMSNSSTMVFDPITGKLQTVGGLTPGIIKMAVPGKKINFTFNPASLSEANSPSTISTNINQKADIFNTLLSVKNKLETGGKISSNQLAIIDNFNLVVTNNLSAAGAIYNKIEDSQKIVDTAQIEIQALLSKKTDVDVAKASIDLQSKQYNLDVLYKISSMVLPKSLMDYL